MRNLPKKIYYVCDAGFGSSAMCAAILRKRFRVEGIYGIIIDYAAADDIPLDADIVFAQHNFKDNIIRRNPDTIYYFLEDIIRDPIYEQLINELKSL